MTTMYLILVLSLILSCDCFTHNTKIFRDMMIHRKHEKTSIINDRYTRQIKTMSSMDDNGDGMMNQEMRSTVPSRKDMCRVFISGVVGTDPRETYLKNGHYVVSFSLAVVGHYQAVHDWEKYKPTETMWVNAEMWDQEAKSNLANLRKGSSFGGIGYMILSKWIDKTSGEEKKVNKMRILKVISPNELNQIFGPLEEVFTSQESIADPAYDQTSNQSNDNNFYQQNAYQNNQRNKPYTNNNNMNMNINNNINNSNKNSNSYANKKRSSNKDDDDDDDDSNKNDDDYSQGKDPRIPF